MCGIAGIYLKNKKARGVSQEGIEQFCDRLLLEIEHRGTHATGYVAVGWDGKVKLDKADVPAQEFIKERDPFPEGTQAVLLHTRFWTKGKPDVMGNNHPVTYGTCFAIHNGSIDNDDELFKTEELKRHFEVDSEIIPAVLDKHTLDSPDTIRKALEKLQGYMAIAAIDPIKHPSRLVLARGENSPLYIFENQNCIVWASTHAAIKDTWGDLVGTPPKPAKIKWISEGKFYIADDYQDLGEYDFKVNKRYKLARRPAQSGWSLPRVSPRTQAPKRPWDADGPFETEAAFKEAVAAYREDPENAGKLVRRWDLHDEYDPSVFADVQGAKQWHSCICNKLVLKEDMQTHLKYGSICKDCYWTIFAGWKAKGETEEAEDSVLAGIELPEIPDADKRNLESWAEYESKVHRYTLQDLSDYVDLSPAAIDYLLYRTNGIASQFGTGMLNLKFKLQTAYDRVEADIHTRFGSEIQREINSNKEVTVEDAQEIADQQQYPWSSYLVLTGYSRKVRYVCEIHTERFDFGDHCVQCLAADAEDAELWGSEDYLRRQEYGGESDVCGVQVEYEEGDNRTRTLNDNITRCEKCNTAIVGICIVCASRKEDEILEVTETACCCKTTRDRKCKRKIALVVENAVVGAQKGYCSQHWNKCSSSKCGAEANFTALDGQRYCHKDSRGRQGIADAAAAKAGNRNIIMEVK